MQTVTIVGAGLAGSEAAYQLAKRGIKVKLYEMRPKKFTSAHKTSGFAELICSNSLRAASIENAVGLLKEEMNRIGSIIMEAAYATKVEAGGALAVDRDLFSEYITNKLRSMENIEIINEEITSIPDGACIIASGPLTSDALHQEIVKLVGDHLYFFDAVAPIITYDSIDMNLSGLDSADPATMLLLLKVQSQLQESMVLSQKLLEPYMNIDLVAIAPPVEINDNTSFGAAIIPKCYKEWCSSTLNRTSQR